jgi:hypothetical protein
MRNNSTSSETTTSSSGGTTSALVDSVEQMVKLPFQMTGATWDFMMQGVRNLTGGSAETEAGYSASTTMNTSSNSSGSNTGATSTTGTLSSLMTSNQDLSGDDLKYVVWSIVFTKPGYECVLEPQQSEIVNYSADGSTFAALKIAKVLEKARNGRLEKNDAWVERNYPAESAKATERRTEVTSSGSDTTVVASTSASQTTETTSNSRERGWRIPGEDQKFITFIYRVDWRLPKQEETVRVERVTIERNTTSTARL